MGKDAQFFTIRSFIEQITPDICNQLTLRKLLSVVLI